MFSRFVRLAVLASCAVFCTSANAAPVNLVGQNTSFLPATPVNDNFAPSFMLPGAIYDHVVPPPDSQNGLYRSPYENADGTMPPAYVGQSYSSVRNGAVGYNFLKPATSLEFLWGSPDSYNTLEFYSGANGGGSLLGSFSLSALTLATEGKGHDYVTFLAETGITFLSVILRSGSPAFEYAGMLARGPDGQTVPEVPLPPAVVLFGTALVGLTLLGRRKRKAVAV
jgi:hypothetical protein